MSAYEKTGDYKSARKIEEERLLAQRKLFEEKMELVDIGLITTRELGFAALRAELILDDDCPTEPIDLDAIQELLGDG